MMAKTWGVVIGIASVAAALLGGSCRTANTPEPPCRALKKPFAYTLCEFAPQSNQTLRLVWRDSPSHQPLLTFDNLLALARRKQLGQVQFAMNAGMYDSKYAPIGYTVIGGQQIRSLNLKNGAGNFHLLPNGVFWWDDRGYHITESQAMAKQLANGLRPTYATQSGPMLVIDGKIHPSFDPQSTSAKLRNGVGVCQDGRVKFVISDTWVSFYQFAQLFKEQLRCDNALFLDGGTASALYSENLERADNIRMGAMVVVTAKS